MSLATLVQSHIYVELKKKFGSLVTNQEYHYFTKMYLKTACIS